MVGGVELTSEHRNLLVRMSLISHGSVAATERRHGGDSTRIAPPGEAHPLHHVWFERFRLAHPSDAGALLEQARAEFEAHVRRQLAPGMTETWEELAGRIVSDGWGVSAEDCARAMRCTPTMVRRARLEQLRHPETGQALPERGDLLGWVCELDRAGLTLRQIEAVAGVSKSTVHDWLKRGARRSA